MQAAWFKHVVRSVVAWVCLTGLNQADEFGADQIDFFEHKVRPLFMVKCSECHGVTQQEGGLRLDGRDEIVRGGDRGPAIVPGHPDKSLLIQAVSYQVDDLAMPPEGKLSRDEIADLRHWIEQRAPWPPEDSTAASSASRQDARQHWAFQPIRKPALPVVRNLDWPQNEIDHFVLARLERAGLAPSPPADPVTLARRIHFDLIGLPPRVLDQRSASAEMLQALVDRLLASPRYGERWARHWLDVARYADTRGYVDGGQARFAFAYTYRDYVIRAFNEDLPFNQFVLDQLAADQREYRPAEQWRLAAMGFLTVGRRFNYNYQDILDDRIDVISRGLQGMTVSCARCHDHKYDPISTADYYSLYGILASSYEPQHPELPVLRVENSTCDSSEHITELQKRAEQYKSECDELHTTIQHELRAYAGDYLVYIVQESPKHRAGTQNPLKTQRTILRGPSAYGYGAIRRWREYIARLDRHDPVFGIWHTMDAVPENRFASELSHSLERDNVNLLLKDRLIAEQPRCMVDLAKALGTLLEQVYAQWQERVDKHSDAAAFDQAAREELRQVLFGPDSPATLTLFESIDCYHLDEHSHMRNLAGKVEELSLDNAQAAPRAMILRQRERPHEPAIFLRGQPNRMGPQVPRQLPAVFSAVSTDGQITRPPGDDRMSLAMSVVSPSNPLAARVFVNRVWHWHFGRPLVDTVSDFGMRSTAPSHPELLDYLAGWFIEQGWSLKKLHRLILASSTYQQSSLNRAECNQIDPDNRLLWRSNARRPEWEVIRDSLLFVSGQLQDCHGGRAVDTQPDDPDSTCRSIFLHIDRQDLPSFARNFDFPSPDFTSPQRPVTTVPQQQLFFLNSPFVRRQAEVLGAQISDLAEADDLDRFRTLYRRIFATAAPLSDREISQWLQVLAAATGGDNPREVWVLTAQALLQSNQFVFIE